MLQCLIHCLEFQFDTVIRDRCLILHRIQLLSFVLTKVRILCWEFFLNRFDTLSLEAQVDLESTGDISCPTGTCFIACEPVPQNQSEVTF